MNVFVLCTGRCGSTTFIKACEHVTNFTAAHESRLRMIGASRMAYPRNHIEADNRLSWIIGTLERVYGDRAHYVHLSRNRDATAASLDNRRWSDARGMSMTLAYQKSFLLGGEEGEDPRKISADLADVLTANIEFFLRDKTNVHRVAVERAKEDFAAFWHWIGAEGDLDAALAEWDVRYNPNPPPKTAYRRFRSVAGSALRAVGLRPRQTAFTSPKRRDPLWSR